MKRLYPRVRAALKDFPYAIGMGSRTSEGWEYSETRTYEPNSNKYWVPSCKISHHWDRRSKPRVSLEQYRDALVANGLPAEIKGDVVVVEVSQ